MPKPPIAVVAAVYSEDPRIAARSAAAAGFGGLLFDAATSKIHLADLSASGLREFRHMLSAANVKLTGLRADLGPKGLAPGADVDRQLNAVENILRAAAALHAPVVCLDLGPLPADPQPPPPKPTITPQQAGLILIPTLSAAPAPESTGLRAIPTRVDPNFIAQVDGALAELGNRADRYGVPLAMHSELSSFAALVRALRAADCPWFGVTLDAVCALQDEWDMDQVFSATGPLLRNVRARDALRGDRQRIQPTPIGGGDVDWPHLLNNLYDAGYSGWITLDTTALSDRPAAASAGRAYLLQHWRS